MSEIQIFNPLQEIKISILKATERPKHIRRISKEWNCSIIHKLSITGASCSLNLPRVNVSDSDIVRVVYSCHDAEPTGNEKWGEEVKQPTVAEEKEGWWELIFTEINFCGFGLDRKITCQQNKVSGQPWCHLTYFITKANWFHKVQCISFLRARTQIRPGKIFYDQRSGQRRTSRRTRK